VAMARATGREEAAALQRRRSGSPRAAGAARLLERRGAMRSFIWSYGSLISSSTPALSAA